MLYFYSGFVVYKKSDKIKNLLSIDILAFSWVVFLVLFIVLRPMRDILVVDAANSYFRNVFLKSSNSLCLLLYACSGLCAFYLTSVYYTKRVQLKSFTVKLASCCFGIYLFQEFILKVLYYKTNFPTHVGPYWLPWCGFTIALIISYIFSYLFLKTKTGKYLIG
jgi:hypothetical protein